MPGKIIMDLPPTPENNRNSEGAFIPLKNGNILFVYSRYGSGGLKDGSPADLYGILSEDNGETFSKPFPVLTRQALGADNIMSVSLERMKNGDIGMFFLYKKDADCLCCFTRSSDEGRSWSNPVLCGPDKGYFIVNNDRILRCQNGTLLIPAACHAVELTEVPGKGNRLSIRTGTLWIFASEDDGFTWTVRAQNIRLPYSRGLTTGVQEPGLVQLSDGTLWCYIRTDAGKQYECFSSDQGKTWSTPLPSWFSSPVSPLSVKRLSDGRLLAVWNPIPIYNGRPFRIEGVNTGARTPLVYALSSDDGETFSTPVVLEDDPRSGYCYTAIFETADGGVMLAYCAGCVEDGSKLSRLRIRKLMMDHL